MKKENNILRKKDDEFVLKYLKISGEEKNNVC
jgi:hypothetical protein